MTQQNQKSDVVTEVLRLLDAFWSRAHDRCDEFYDDYDHGYAELENEPFDCEVAAARIRRVGEEGDKISIDYNAIHIYNACTGYSCGPSYTEDMEVDYDAEAHKSCEEKCLEEVEQVANTVFNEYRRVIEKWAKKRKVKYTEELKRDEFNFTLTIHITPP
jgi:hypothetical protein